MANQSEIKVKKEPYSNQSWPWWPLLPLYPYGRRRTVFEELIPGNIWGFQQLQGLYYVAVPVRLTVVKVSNGLMLINPLPPTSELLRGLSALEKQYGPVLTIVLPTASGLEHKISLPALARSFPKADLWVCPGQWSFPFALPLDWLGVPKSRTKVLLDQGLPHQETCSWISLGPLDIGLGRFQEVACFHKPSRALMVTDALIGIESKPPELFDLDPTPLLFHARDRGDQLFEDSPQMRKKGWARLVLFASFLRPKLLEIPPLLDVIRNSFKPGLRNAKAHFGLFPFTWKEGWEISASNLMGDKKPLIQVAPVLERLVFPRAKQSFIKWLDELIRIKGIRWLVPAHFSAPIEFRTGQVKRLRNRINNSRWATGEGDWGFLDTLDNTLLKRGVVPSDPLEAFKDQDLQG